MDYSSRHCLFQAASKFYKATSLSTEAFSEVLAEVQRGGSTDVDLLIRTGGERRFLIFCFGNVRLRNLYFWISAGQTSRCWICGTRCWNLRSARRTRGALPRECAS